MPSPDEYYVILQRRLNQLKTPSTGERRRLYAKARGQLRENFSGLELSKERAAIRKAIMKVEERFQLASRETKRLEQQRLSLLERKRAERPPPSLGRELIELEVERLRQQEKEDRRRARTLRREQDALKQEKRWSKRKQKKAIKLVENKRQREQKEEEERLRTHAMRSAASRAALAEVASPTPSLSADGRLDAGPNILYDAPTVDDELPTLPIRQRVLIRTILSNLPPNSPKHLRYALSAYDDELGARGTQPILGLLKDMAAVVDAEASPTGGEEWLEKGVRAAFERFAENHDLFLKHFPLDSKRENLYAQIPIDEDSAVGPLLSKPFESVAKATSDANKAGLTTDEFKKIIDTMTEFAKVISTLPPQKPYFREQKNLTQGSVGEGEIEISPADRITPDNKAVSPKKRMLLSGFGFFERVYNLLGSTAQLTSPAEGNVLLTALREAVKTLTKLLS